MNQNLKDFFDVNKHEVIDVVDSEQIAQITKDRNDGKMGVELIYTESGEIVALPSNMADKIKGTRLPNFVGPKWALL